MSEQETFKDVAERRSVVEHAQAPDYDPYGWIAAQEDKPESEPVTVENSVGEQVPVIDNYAVVWPHTLEEPQKFPNAVAKVLPNGTLLVMPVGSDCPIKGYAPGAWSTFEHVGEAYHRKPQTLRQATAAADVAAKGYVDSVDVTSDQDSGRITRVWNTDPQRRTPPTLDADADDTQNIPAVEFEADQVGGGVERPKAPGARADAGRTGRTPRPATVETDEDAYPSRLRTLWRSLKGNPDETS